jgi:outer membrane protein assembly factor BamD (BamD/ComL family)
MSLLKEDARAAIPSEYSRNDKRNPNNLMNISQANLDQIVADSAADIYQKKSQTCRSTIEPFINIYPTAEIQKYRRIALGIGALIFILFYASMKRKRMV